MSADARIDAGVRSRPSAVAESDADACVDVVVDVAASRLGTAFTYRVGGVTPVLGLRVRVPFRGRSVGGWIVSEAARRPDATVLKTIEGLDAGQPPLDPALVRLAEWMHRRYACTFREAIAAVAARGAVRTHSAAFAFVPASDAGDATARILRGRFGDKPFTAVAARRVLRAAGTRIGLDETRRELERLVRTGSATRAARKQPKPAAARRSWAARLTDASAAKTQVQRRIAAVLADRPDGQLDVSTLAKAANTAAASVRRAERAGVCAIVEHRAGPTPDAARARHQATPDQRSAIDAVENAVHDGAVLLLHGITGSGKTFVYARSIERLRERGGRAIVLVPEISLTPQTAAHFAALYGSRVGVLHSGLSEGDRTRVWEDAVRGELDVVVGARSAVFAPLPNLQLIVVDEEHEPSYKQDVAPRYDTAAVARERMRQARGGVVLGSATPSLESYAEAKAGGIRYVRLAERATSAPLPPVEIVDMTAEEGPGGRKPLGVSLVSAISGALERREKILLFVNRRGYAGLLLCRACGFAPQCRRCAISLVVHTSDGSMRCHVCGDAYKVAVRCPKCGAQDLKPYGFGTQRVEEEVRALFPSAKIVRMDSDTTGSRGAHGALLDTFGTQADILIGTQMIAKGLDFPTVTVVGVVAADMDLNRPDFRAAERTFGLLTQVAGRAGRAAPGARVVVQTYSPGHYAVKLAALHDYEAFAVRELALRKELQYPPFGRLAYLSIAGTDRNAVAHAGVRVGSMLRGAAFARDVEVLGPAPEPLAKARGEYRMRIAIKAQHEGPLLDACAAAREVHLDAGLRLVPIVDPR